MFVHILSGRKKRTTIRFDVDAHGSFWRVPAADYTEAQALLSRPFLVRDRVDEEWQGFGSSRRYFGRRGSRSGRWRLGFRLRSRWQRFALRVGRPRPTLVTRLADHGFTLRAVLLDRGQGRRSVIIVIARRRRWRYARSRGGCGRRAAVGTGSSWRRRRATLRRHRPIVTATSNDDIHVLGSVL